MSERTFSQRARLASSPIDSRLRVQMHVATRRADPCPTDHQDGIAAGSVEIEPAIVSDFDQREAAGCVVDVSVAAREAVELSVCVGEAVVELTVIERDVADPLTLKEGAT